MNILRLLLYQMLPLYTLILVGYICGKYIHIKKEGISKLMLYVMLPITSFDGVLTSQISFSVLSLPLLSFLLCSLMALLVLFAGSFLWKDGTKNMLAVGIANGNFGFLGVPLTILFLGAHSLAPTVLFGLGAAFFVNTLGMFLAARANFNLKESFVRTAKMPFIYASLFGLALNLLKVPLPPSITQALNDITVGYSVLGLSLVGIAIAELGKVKVDWRLMLFSLLATYILWPLVAFGFIALDKSIFMFYSNDIHRIVLLMAIVPIGVSIVAISTELKEEPEKAAFVVLFTTLISLIYIPVFIALFF